MERRFFTTVIGVYSFIAAVKLLTGSYADFKQYDTKHDANIVQLEEQVRQLENLSEQRKKEALEKNLCKKAITIARELGIRGDGYYDTRIDGLGLVYAINHKYNQNNLAVTFWDTSSFDAYSDTPDFIEVAYKKNLVFFAKHYKANEERPKEEIELKQYKPSEEWEDLVNNEYVRAGEAKAKKKKEAEVKELKEKIKDLEERF